MAGYGSFPDVERGNRSAGVGRTKDKQSKPIFLENPDGTIAEGIPCNRAVKVMKSLGKDPDQASSERAESDTSASDRSELALSGEVDFLYRQHERVLKLMLFVQLLVDILYDYVYVIRMLDGTSVKELQAVYGWRVQVSIGQRILWVLFALHTSFTLVYYGTAAHALWTKQPASYRFFADCSLVKIASLILLLYVDKFNLILFFLYLATFIYGRFLQGLTVSLLLLPPIRPAS